MILHLLLRFLIEGDTKMCVIDYCPNNYRYRMILITISFSCRSLVSAFGMLYLYLLLNLSASLIPSIERQVGLLIVICSWKSRCPCHPHQKRDKCPSSLRFATGKSGTCGVVIRSLDPLSVASNLINVI